MNNSLWCPLLHKSILTENDGTYRTCCHGKEIAVTDQGQPMTRLTHSLSEVFHSGWLNNIRNDLELGLKHPNCDYCWQLEDAGVESFRQTSINLLGQEDRRTQLEILDLSLGNQCNLKCRTCTPEDSSVWVQEAYDLSDKEIPFADYQRKMIILESEDSEFFNDLKSNLKTVRIIKMFGGEPFMMKRTWQLLKEAVDQNYSKDIELYFNTNGTFWEEKNVQLFDNFKRVDIGLSIDGVGDRFEYMRHPAKWKEVESNIEKIVAWKGTNPNRELFLTHTVSAYNIWYVHEVVNLARKYKLNLYINPCLLEGDSFAVQYIPKKVKNVIDQHLLLFDYTEQEFREISKITDYKPEGSDWKEWLREVNKRDNYRNESFQKTFPEYYNMLKSIGVLDDTSL